MTAVPVTIQDRLPMPSGMIRRPPATASSGLALGDVIRILKQRIFLILFAWLFLTGATAGLTAYLVKYHQKYRAETMIEIVEEGMSSEIYELMKRPDERFVVDKAHRRPRFVEDSVREMVRGVVERFPGLPDDAFVQAHQANFETIHTHDVEAERSGTLGEIRRELADGVPPGHHTTLAEWLTGRVPAA